MKKKTPTIVMSLILFGCFFLPYFFMQSGFDIVFKSTFGMVGLGWGKYLWLLVPVSAIMLLLGESDGKYFIGKNTLEWIPLLTLLFIIVWLKIKTYSSIGNLLEGMGYGFWISLATSLMLKFYNPKRKK